MSLQGLVVNLPILSSKVRSFCGIENRTEVEQRKLDRFKIFAPVVAAQQEMKSVKLSTYWIDIFDEEKLSYAKALLSERYIKEIETSYGFDRIGCDFELTLEGYTVDKYLSRSINLNIVHDALLLFEATSREAQDLKDKERSYYRAPCQTAEHEQYVKNHTAAIDFIGRILKRLYIQEQAKLCRELPLPQLSQENLSRFKEMIHTMETTGKHLTDIGFEEDGLTPAESSSYKTYLATLFGRRNERMQIILRDAYRRDKVARESDPQAPLTHLVTLESYENKIYQKRLHLFLKVAAVALSLFFLRVAPRLI